MNSPKISLCIIAGNVEQYITRFLDAFASIVDDIVVVRAMGNQEPDRTMEIAKERRCIVAEYKNHVTSLKDYGIGHDWQVAPSSPSDWPHTDNFAAARNLAFSLASHDWILWADTDDIIDPASIARIKAVFAAQHETTDCFSFEYAVPEDGLTVIKDRLVRKSAARWRYRVHEEMQITCDNPRFVIIDGARITHMPSGSRERNDARNLRLLDAMIADGTITTGHLFHRVNSLRALGRMNESVTAAAALLKQDDLADPERYELLMTLAQMCQDVRQQKQLYLQALSVDPSRREAYGELAVNACRQMALGEMLAWTTAMMALPPPEGYLWSHREQYHGWGGIRLHAMALRLNKRRVTGDTLQLNHFKKHGAKISLLHATKGRSKQALQMQSTWMNRAAAPDAVEHIFAVDADDEQALPMAANLSVVLSPGGGCVAAWNAAAEKSSGAVLVQMSDDFMPPMHWDRIILDRLGDLSAPKVLAVADGTRTDALLCMAILTRARYEQQGFLFHPEFKSMYSDNYFTHCAYRDRCVIEARDVIFEHLHPAFGKAEMDATYTECNAQERYNAGLETFNRLVQNESE